MSKALCISAAIAMALSGTAIAGGTKVKSSAATGMSQSAQFSQKDCEMLSVKSARQACMQSAVRSEGGIDASAVGGTSGAGAMAEGRMQLKSDAAMENSSPSTYSADHR